MKNLERTKSTILLKTLAILVSIAMLSACETEDFTWQEAVDCCNELELAGYSDWRLPDVKELQGIVESVITSMFAW